MCTKRKRQEETAQAAGHDMPPELKEHEVNKKARPGTSRELQKYEENEQAKKLLAEEISTFIAAKCRRLCLELKIFYNVPMPLHVESVRSADTVSSAYVTSAKLERKKRALKTFIEHQLRQEGRPSRDGITLVRIDYHQPLLEEEEEPQECWHDYVLVGPVHSVSDGIITCTRITMKKV